MLHKNKSCSIIRSTGTVFYSLLYLNSRRGFNGLKYMYSVISVIVDSLPGNTKNRESLSVFHTHKCTHTRTHKQTDKDTNTHYLKNLGTCESLHDNHSAHTPSLSLYRSLFLYVSLSFSLSFALSRTRTLTHMKAPVSRCIRTI